jgi:hypothetical protein
MAESLRPHTNGSTIKLVCPFMVFLRLGRYNPSTYRLLRKALKVYFNCHPFNDVFLGTQGVPASQGLPARVY